MAEPIHEEEMPDATGGAERQNGEIDGEDRSEPITKTIRIVSVKAAESRQEANYSYESYLALRRLQRHSSLLTRITRSATP